MQKTVLAILGAVLLAGPALQSATAKEHHHVRKSERPPVATSQPFRNSNAAIWAAPRNEPNWYAPAVESGRPNYYRDEALSPPAGH
jgi:hypothetical protein